ncbi:kelch-like protein 21 [Branchiostoma floridae x Branchiostoma belcheri]
MAAYFQAENVVDPSLLGALVGPMLSVSGGQRPGQTDEFTGAPCPHLGIPLGLRPWAQDTPAPPFISADVDYATDESGNLKFTDKIHSRTLAEGLRRLVNTKAGPTDLTCHLTERGCAKVFKSESLIYDYECEDVFKKIRNLRLAGKFCDLTVKVGKLDIPCHRMVLAAFSNYFELMLFGDFVESKNDYIWLRDVSAPIVNEIMDYAYSGEITITSKNVETLMHASSIFQLVPLAKACCEFLRRQLDVENSVGIMKFADLYTRKKLAEEARAYILENLPQVSCSEDFRQLTLDDMESIVTDRACRWGRETVFEAVLKWIRPDETGLKEHLPQLLKKMKLRLMNEGYLENTVKTSAVVMRSKEAMGEVSKVEDEISEHKKKTFTTQVVVQVGGISGGEQPGCQSDKVSHIDVLEPESRCWAIISSIPDRIKYCCHAVSAWDNDIYILATFDDKGRSEFWRFATQTNIWYRLPDPLLPHQGRVRLETLNGRVYAIGDMMQVSSYEDCFEAYDPSTNTWNKLRKILKSVRKIATAVCRGKLFVFGYEGDDPQERAMEVQCYDPGSDTWDVESVSSYHGGKRQYQAIGLGNKIYMMPILGRFFTMCAYDVDLMDYLKVPAPKNSHLQCGMTTLGDGIIITGGRDTFEAAYLTPAFEYYDPAVDSWEILGIQPNHIRRAHSCVTVNNCQWIQARVEKAKKAPTLLDTVNVPTMWGRATAPIYRETTAQQTEAFL